MPAEVRVPPFPPARTHTHIHRDAGSPKQMLGNEVAACCCFFLLLATSGAGTSVTTHGFLDVGRPGPEHVAAVIPHATLAAVRGHASYATGSDFFFDLLGTAHIISSSWSPISSARSNSSITYIYYFDSTCPTAELASCGIVLATSGVHHLQINGDVRPGTTCSVGHGPRSTTPCCHESDFAREQCHACVRYLDRLNRPVKMTRCPVAPSSSSAPTPCRVVYDCMACQLGQDREGVSCPNCPPGRWGSSGGYCRDCPAGLYGAESGYASVGQCKTCGTGKWSSDGSASCTPCRRGKYSHTTAATAESMCLLCPRGQRGTMEGASSKAEGCADCPRGWWGAGLNDCQGCAPGKFGIAVGARDSSNCTSCPRGWFSEFAAGGSWRCLSCEQGRYNEQRGRDTWHACAACAAGMYNPDRGGAQRHVGHSSVSHNDYSLPGCKACPAGWYNSFQSHDECKACPIGRYHPSQQRTSLSQCLACPGDSYSGSVGTATCKQCPQNTTTNGVTGATNATVCICKPGYTGGNCQMCPANTYKSNAGSQACDACASGRVTDPTVVSDAAYRCRCPIGRQINQTNPDGPCETCPVGMYSDKPAMSCKGCPGGTHVNFRGATSVFQCT